MPKQSKDPDTYWNNRLLKSQLGCSCCGSGYREKRETYAPRYQQTNTRSHRRLPARPFCLPSERAQATHV